MQTSIDEMKSHYFQRMFYEGIYGSFVYTLDEPMPLDLHENDQYEWILSNVKLALANQVYLDLHGLRSEKEAVEMGYKKFLTIDSDTEAYLIRMLVETSFRLNEFVVQVPSAEEELSQYISNTVHPVFEDGLLVSLWGHVTDVSFQKNRDKLLKDSERLFRRAIENSPVAVALLKDTGHVNYLNQKFVDTFGYTTQDITHLSEWWKKTNPTKVERQVVLKNWLEAIARVEQGKRVFEPQVSEIICKDGCVRHVRMHYTRFGKVILVTLDDITVTQKQEEEILIKNNKLQALNEEFQVINEELQERNVEYEALNEELQTLNKELNDQNIELGRLNSELAQREASYKLLADNISDVITTHNMDWKYRYVSKSSLTVMGYEPEDLINQSLLDYIHPEDVYKFESLYKDLVQGRQVRLDYRLRNKSGRYQWFETLSKPIKDEKGKAYRIINSTRDISDQHRAEDDLMLSLERQMKAEEIGKVGAWDWDMVNNKIWWSAYHYTMLDEIPFSFDPDFDKILTYVHPDDKAKLQQAVEKALLGSDHFAETFRVITKEGKEKVFFGKGIIHRDKQWNPVRWVGADIDITELYESKAALEKRDKQYEVLFNSFHDIYYEANTDGILEVMTPSIKKALGYRPEEVLGKHVTELYKFPEERFLVLEKLKQDGEIRGFCFVLIGRNNVERVCEANITWRYDEDGNKTGTKGTIRDITKLKKIEQRIIDRQHLLHTLIHTMREGVVLYGKDGRIEEINHFVADVLGMSRQEVLSYDIFTLPRSAVHEDHTPFLPKQHPAYITLNERRAVNNVVMGICKEGEVMTWININSQPLLNKTSGELEKVIVTFSDITQIKQHQEKLEELALVAQSSINSVAIADKDKVIRWVNSSFTKLTGYTFEEVQGRRVGSLLKGELTDVAVVKYINNRLDHGLSAKADLINYRKNGEHFWVELDIHPVRDDKGDVVKYISIQTDISSRKQYEEELLQKNKQLTKTNFELDNFVYRISHDIRSPLSSSLGLLYLMDVEKLVEHEKNPYVNILKRTLKTQEKILNDILDYSVNSRDEIILEKINLHQMLGSLFETLKYMDMTGGQVILLLEFSENEVLVMDKSRLEFIVRNIFSNAIKYRDRQKDYHYIKVFLEDDGTNYLLKIEDNGIGIYPNDLPNIFGMFYRAESNTNGAGLGLYIVRETVEKLGGKISVTSQKNIYTCFSISLPKLSM